MTSVLQDDDKIFTMYKQYKNLIREDAKKNDDFVYGIDQLAANLSVAHMLDHVVCLLKNKEEDPVRVKKVNDTWRNALGDSTYA